MHSFLPTVSANQKSISTCKTSISDIKKIDSIGVFEIIKTKSLIGRG